MLTFIVDWLAYTPIFATPLLLATLGLILNERAGVLNLGAEGLFLCGALAAVVVYLATGGSPWLGMGAALAAGAAVSVLFAFLVVTLRADQVVTGITIAFFGSGLTALLGTAWMNKAVGGFTAVKLGFLSELPVVGKIVFAQDPIVYLTIPIVYLVWRFLFRTMPGLRLRAVGENPQAADAAGVSVDSYRSLAVIAGGALCGAAGGYVALAGAKIWFEDMTQGRGWIAIVLVIFARWMPGRAVFGAVLFGSIEALIPRIFAAGIPVPQYFLQMTPFVATLIVLVYAALYTRARGAAPGALGLPYVREDRR
jgi:simple sugar transport system permease protein